ncbi:glycine-rich domain-containing protein [Chitinophaga solisilvae]|uniref:glycine-rich domain-containing protein n=1 Tax=Chitinophaga solisilvae TaxID=1233460 RepID=UPI00137035E2|nr:hypothetical protein [Chitinophaga solisilvae]
MKNMHLHNHRPREGGTHTADRLWELIDHFCIDDPDAAFPFSRKLARENNWSRDFTGSAIAEYKRFIYLCCISPTGASPSYIIDQVWHLHLQYTVNYWEEFCGKILGRSIHHHPSRGGPSETEKHGHWRNSTLLLYEKTFGESPPQAIWSESPPVATPTWLSRLKKFFSSGFPLSCFLLLTASSILLTGCRSGALTSMAFLFGFFMISRIIAQLAADNPSRKKDEHGHTTGNGSSCSGGSSGCSSGCSGGGCGGGCGGCGGGGCGS